MKRTRQMTKKNPEKWSIMQFLYDQQSFLYNNNNNYYINETDKLQ